MISPVEVMLGPAVLPSADGTETYLAIPKSMTFAWPSPVSITLAGFRSRWTMPRWRANSSASAISEAMRKASGSGIGPRASRSLSVSPSTSSMAMKGTPEGARALADFVDLGDEGMIEPGGGVRLAQQPPPRRLVRHLAFGQELERDLAIELKILGQIDLSHPSLADFRENPVVRDLAADHGASGRVGVAPS